MISIVDYGSGNVYAIANIYEQLRIPHVVTADRKTICESSHIILAGVGSFDVTMSNLRRSGLADVILDEVTTNQKYILGICVGMQILANSSQEGTQEGLGLIAGSVNKFDPDSLEGDLKLPHMGWNSIAIESNDQLFQDIDREKGFYFLHTYYFSPDNIKHRIASSNYGREFACMVQSDRIYGAQFHPEKSHSNGIALLRNFASLKEPN